MPKFINKKNIKIGFLATAAVLFSLNLSGKTFDFYYNKKVDLQFSPNAIPVISKEEMQFAPNSSLPSYETEVVVAAAHTTSTPKSKPVAQASTVAVSVSQGLPAAEVQQIYSLINSHRSANGLAPLAVNSLLVKSASLKNNYMASSGVFAHGSWAGYFKSAGYNYKTAGENLAEGFSNGSAVVSAWKNSPGHNANLLNASYKDMGVHTVCGVDMPGYPNTCLITLHLGSR